MRMKNEKGTAMIELVACAPLIAIFLLIIIQFAALFDQVVSDIAHAEAEASRAVNEWDAAHRYEGFKRPCIEDMDRHSITYGGEPVAIGADAWGRTISVPQEVKIVSEPICISW